GPAAGSGRRCERPAPDAPAAGPSLSPVPGDLRPCAPHFVLNRSFRSVILERNSSFRLVTSGGLGNDRHGYARDRRVPDSYPASRPGRPGGPPRQDPLAGQPAGGRVGAWRPARLPARGRRVLAEGL